MEEAVKAECEAQKCAREEVTKLVLDGRVRVAGPVKGLEHMPSLKTLSLVGCKVNSLEGFPLLPALKHLNLSDNPISGGLDALVAACPSLVGLELSNCRLGSLDALQPLARLAQLRKLDLQDCPLAAAGGYRSRVLGLLPQVAVLDHVGKDSQPGEEEDDEDDDDEEEEGEEDDEGEDEDGEGEDEDEEDDDGLGTAFLVHGNADGLADDDDFAGEEEPESEDIDEEEDEDEGGAGAAKKPRTE